MTLESCQYNTQISNKSIVSLKGIVKNDQTPKENESSIGKGRFEEKKMVREK